MAISLDTTQPITTHIQEYQAPPELLVSAVLHLLSQYNRKNLANSICIQSATTIERHLRILSDWPGVAPVLRATCQQLSDQWALMVARAIPKPERSTFITRLISSTRDNTALP